MLPSVTKSLQSRYTPFFLWLAYGISCCRERSASNTSSGEDVGSLPWKAHDYLSGILMHRRKYSNTVTGPAIFQPRWCCENKRRWHKLCLGKQRRWFGENKHFFQLNQLHCVISEVRESTSTIPLFNTASIQLTLTLTQNQIICFKNCKSDEKSCYNLQVLYL